MACFGAGFKDDIEQQLFSEDDEEEVYKEIPARTFSHKARPSRDDMESFRFMVLGGDDPLMNEACETILGIRHTEYANVIRIRELIKTNISGRKVSVLKTPFYWLKYLKPNTIFRKSVNSIKKDMKSCESLLFPGPHIFLLVLGGARNSGKEDLLLQAVRDVFGKKALDYSMVLFIGECRDKDIKSNLCVKKCRNRYHILENTENLLDYVGTVIQERENSYFTNDFELTERAKDHFQTEFGMQNLESAERERSLRSKLVEITKTVEDLRKENTDLKSQLTDSTRGENLLKFDDLTASTPLKELDEPKGRAIQSAQELNDSYASEIQFSKEMVESKARENRFSKELDESKARENRFSKELDEFKARENQFRKELDESIARENRFSKELDESKSRENQFRKELDDSKARENRFSKELGESKDREIQLNDDNKNLQSGIMHLKATVKDLNQNLKEAKAKEAFLFSRVQAECSIIQKIEELQVKERDLCERRRELDFRERNLELKERELDMRERDLLQRDIWSDVSESGQYSITSADPPTDKFRAHEGDGAESRDGDLQVVRRSSLPFEPPNMSESVHGPVIL